MRKIVFLALAVVALAGCGNPDYDPDRCAMWTDLYNTTGWGEHRVDMDRYCTR